MKYNNDGLPLFPKKAIAGKMSWKALEPQAERLAFSHGIL